MIYPIGFAIPESKIVSSIPKKCQVLSSLVPGVLTTYTYETEDSYREEYKKSIFAITCKKAGWDCMRHYEILACGSIPLFIGLNYVPEKDMTIFPKKILNETQERLLPHMNTLPLKDLEEMAEPYINRLLHYTRKHLTTKALAAYVRDKVNPKAANILFLSHPYGVDYLRCNLLHGFKELYREKCIDWPRVHHLYTDFPEEYVSSLYGKGMHCSRLLDPSTHSDVSEDQVLEGIRGLKYDMIIYGSFHRGCPFLDLVTEIYPKEKVAFVCGEDIHSCEAVDQCKQMGYTLFLREFECPSEQFES